MATDAVLLSLKNTLASTASPAYAAPPLPQNIFLDEGDLARMVRDPAFLEKARKAIVEYAAKYHWSDGTVKDFRFAYDGQGHDFSGTACTFGRFWRECKG